MTMSNIDELTMRLVHYFVTKENYQPIIVNGVENEIWLENPERKYSVIRINSNYIHNDEQLDFDLFKTKNVIKQIKKKTFSIKCDSLSILLNVGENVDTNRNVKHFDICELKDVEDFEKNDLFSKMFPEIKNDIVDSKDQIDFFINVTNDINKETEKKNKLYEKTFTKKPLFVTYLLIIINVLVFLFEYTGMLDLNNFSISYLHIQHGNISEFYRLITAPFFHVDITHILCNMYSLYVIGSMVEQVAGKIKYVIVYFISALMGCLLSCAINCATGSYVQSVGASGAIFGLIGFLLYFGYHYRVYLGNVLISKLLPITILNLALGFMINGIDNYAHIGGLLGGWFAGMIVGVEGKTDKSDRVNGIIVTTILIAFLLYIAAFK